MDGLILIIIAIVFVVLDSKAPIDDETQTEEVYETSESSTRVTKLNEEFYDDPNAFSIIINALGYPKER